MNPRLWIPLLAGMLTASVWSNLRAWTGPERPPATSATEATPLSPCLDLSHLDLRPEQRTALETLGRECCAVENECQDRSAELEARLVELLGTPDADPESVRACARELAEQRTLTLERCVDTILAVRAVLDPEQNAHLTGGWAACVTGGTCESDGECSPGSSCCTGE